MAYDANGNVASITPPGRPLHSFDYTDIDLENLYTPPNVAPPLVDTKTYFTYNLDKQVTSITRPDGQVINMAYDTGGRIGTITLPDSPPGNPQVYSYAFNATTGLLDRVTAPDGGALAFTYDGTLLLGTSWEGAGASVTGTVSQTYDNDFRPDSISVNGGNTISFGYDLDGLLTSAGAETLSYDLTNGLMTGTTLGSVTDSYSYSGFGEVDSYTAQANAVDQFVTGYTRDKLGRITQKTETIQGVAHTFDYTYNPAGYLVEVKRDGAITDTYTYDLNGNRQNNGAVYDDQDRLTATSSATYTYTDNGKLLTKTEGALVTSYTYDVVGNLKKVVLPSGTTIEYVVGASNRRIGRKVDGTLEKAWLYKDDLNPIAEFDWDAINEVWVLSARFVYASRVNVPDFVIKGGVTYRIISDHLGSPRLVINSADGTVVEAIEYDDWGNVLSDTNPGFLPFGYAGGLYDLDTKLVRFGARDYDAETGRWTAKDPIRFDGDGTNLYGYVLQDPINSFDPSGLTEEQVWQLYELARRENPDLFFPDSIVESWFLSDEWDGMGTMGNIFLWWGAFDKNRVFNCYELKKLLTLLIHEALHLKYGWENEDLQRAYGKNDGGASWPFTATKHDGIYAEAENRADIIWKQECICIKAQGTTYLGTERN